MVTNSNNGRKENLTAAGEELIVSPESDARIIADDFMAAVAPRRHRSREEKGDVPA